MTRASVRSWQRLGCVYDHVNSCVGPAAPSGQLLRRSIRHRCVLVNAVLGIAEPGLCDCEWHRWRIGRERRELDDAGAPRSQKKRRTSRISDGRECRVGLKYVALGPILSNRGPRTSPPDTCRHLQRHGRARSPPGVEERCLATESACQCRRDLWSSAAALRLAKSANRRPAQVPRALTGCAIQRVAPERAQERRLSRTWVIFLESLRVVRVY